MSGAPQPLDTRELRERLEIVIGPRARFEDVEQARDAAVRARLPGLARVLGVLEARAGRPWPAELLPVLDRLRRLVAHPAVRAGMIETLRAADHGLAVLAGEAEALQWTPAADDARVEEVATLSALDALGERRLTDAGAVERAAGTRLGAAVAASLRAALDWLVGDSSAPLAFTLTDGVLEVVVPGVHASGLRAASEVIAAVEGNLRPGAEPDAWTLRVPTFGARACYLMVLQDQAPLALPWHAVLRVRMVDAARVEPVWRDPVPLVDQPPLATPGAGGVPLVRIAHGRKQAWLLCDRIVWRMMAEREPAPAVPPLPGLSRQVRTDEGERWWLAEPGWLLQSVPAPPLPEDGARNAPAAPLSEAARKPARARAVEDSHAPGPSPAGEIATLPEVEPAGIVEAEVGEPSRAFGAPSPEIENDEFDRAFDASFAPETEEIAPSTWAPPALSEHADPQPFESEYAPAESVPAAPASPERAEAEEPVATRRALVAEDSITARVFLARMLEQRGFEVEAVDSAAALDAALAHGRHDLACVDVELPDAGGEPFLTRLAGDVAGRGLVLVALVRDADDADAARRAGVHRTLGKPFDDRALDELLARLGFERA